MRKYAESDIFSDTPDEAGKAIIVEVKSTGSNRTYRVDLTAGRCSCPAWKFQKGGERSPCKHLRSLGFTKIIAMTDLKEPKKEVAPAIYADQL